MSHRFVATVATCAHKLVSDTLVLLLLDLSESWMVVQTVSWLWVYISHRNQYAAGSGVACVVAANIKRAALLATATRLPMYSGVAPLVPPPASTGKSFNIMQHWGNLSPYHTANHGLDDSSALIPEGCELDEMHWLQRHGARYPTSNPHGPAGFAQRVLKAKNWKASGQLDFLNNWTYMLGAELLTPFGRSQLYNLGVAARVHYGFLLDRFEDRLPVLRTTSQDRMLHSALNWAAGFFGIPAESQHHLEIIIEAPRFNNSLAPYHTCPNDAKVSILAAFHADETRPTSPCTKSSLSGTRLSSSTRASVSRR